jgi:uncharacterized protein with HEPN domain
MLPESQKRLGDMVKCAALIEQFMVGKSLADFMSDELLRSGVYYQFLIIGEALTAIRDTERPVAEQITEYQRIIAFRNQVIHGYQKIDDEITWRIIEQKVPILRRELEELLKT